MIIYKSLIFNFRTINHILFKNFILTKIFIQFEMFEKFVNFRSFESHFQLIKNVFNLSLLIINKLQISNSINNK